MTQHTGLKIDEGKKNTKIKFNRITAADFETNTYQSTSTKLPRAYSVHL
ncbi:hypothetical protein ACJRPK_06260 [Aquimarina sp. 2-A2]